MAISANDLPSANLPAEEPQPGEATQMDRARKAIESQGSGRRTAPQGAPQAAPPGGQPQSAAPVQPPPRTPLTQADLQPGGPVFMQPRMLPAAPWRQQLRTWAQHPEARVLRQLNDRAEAQFKRDQKPGPPPQQ